MELVEPHIANMECAWIPLLGALLVVLAFIAAVVITATTKKATRPRKVLSIFVALFWTCLFIGGEILLFNFASDERVTGAHALFILCSCCICTGGLIALGANVWHLLELTHTKRVDHDADQDLVNKTTSQQEAELPLIEEETQTNLDETNIESPSSSDALHEEGDTPAQQTPSRIFKVAYRVFTEILSWALPLLAIGAVTLLSFLFLELPSNTSFLNLADRYVACELSIIAGVVAGIWLICQRRPIGLVIPMALAFLYGLAEYFVEKFKSAAIMPGDLRSANTGLSVAGGYEYELTSVLLFVIALFAITVGLLTWLKDPLRKILARKEPRPVDRKGKPFSYEQMEKKHTWSYVRYFIKNVCAVALSLLLGLYLITTPITRGLEPNWEERGIVFDYWRMDNAVNNFGLIPAFIASLQLEDINAPEGYSHDEAVELQAGLVDLYDEYIEPSSARQAAISQFDQTKPNVVLVMNESFTDLSFFNGLGVDYPGLEYLQNMDAIAKGATSVSVYGGNTCNSEFESLSGVELGYISGAINPYPLYDLSQIDTIPKQFKEMGYETTAIHPEVATNWCRDSVYPAIGFDQFIDRTAFEDAERVRDHVRDSATYEKVIEQLTSSDQPQFVFDLTMMGHGGYETGLIPEDQNVNYDFTDIVDPDAAAATNEYLSSVRMSDEDIQQLILELEQLDEPTVLVFFGDHQPGFSWWYKDIFADESNETALEETLYQTNYFIWANYDIAGSDWVPNSHTQGASTASYPLIESDSVEYRGTMAPAMLMSWTMSYIGAPLTDFEKATYVGRSWIQSSNLYGYMDANGTWHPESELEAVNADTIFTQGEAIIAGCAEAGALPSPTETSATTDAVMANVMKWLNYLNFAEKLK